jgi:hypothetical protein
VSSSGFGNLRCLTRQLALSGPSLCRLDLVPLDSDGHGALEQLDRDQ